MMGVTEGNDVRANEPSSPLVDSDCEVQSDDDEGATVEGERAEGGTSKRKGVEECRVERGTSKGNGVEGGGAQVRRRVLRGGRVDGGTSKGKGVEEGGDSSEGDSGDEDVVCNGDGFDETRISDDEGVKSTQYSILMVYVRCKVEGCDWGINLVKMHDESTFQIRQYKSDHTCAPTFNVCNLKSSWLGKKYISDFQNYLNRKLDCWRKDKMRALGIYITRQQAYRARVEALELIEEFPAEQYLKL
ncbi:hypothetical protein ACS0TY_008114 [Phlomoides rotata]